MLEAATDQLSGIETVTTSNVCKYLLRWKQKNGLEEFKILHRKFYFSDAL